ncbi:hypothetical protein ABT224_20105 [Streptomyces sp. NPDC001584]|uniref:hypothetical protein n=1 Tax=Streptomyces sp. NPDC001584 TaxID=3154521 RepID=UPI003329924E
MRSIGAFMEVPGEHRKAQRPRVPQHQLPPAGELPNAQLRRNEDTMTNTQATPALTSAQQKALGALSKNRGATAKEVAEYAGIGGSTAGKALTALEGHGLAHRELGERNGARKTADRWYKGPAATSAETEPEAEVATAEEAPPAEAETPADAPAPAEAATEPEEPPAAPTAPAKAPAPAPAKRLARGGLRQMVYEHLEAHPTKAFTAPALSKALGRSAGAVANALVKLKDHGQADLVGESPRQYRLTGQA